MRWCAHGITQTACAMWRAPNGGRLRRRGSHGQIAVERCAHAVPPTVCAHCLAEMWRAALERGARPPRDMRACVAKVNHSLRFWPGYKCNHPTTPHCIQPPLDPRVHIASIRLRTALANIATPLRERPLFTGSSATRTHCATSLPISPMASEAA